MATAREASPQAYSVLSFLGKSRIEPPAPALPKGVASVKRRQECIFQSPRLVDRVYVYAPPMAGSGSIVTKSEL